jgi:hypothetical protein
MIGPRPELIDEAIRDGGVAMFHMYNSEQFMRYAKDYLGLTVNPESIAQIREEANYLAGIYGAKGYRAELAVLEWLKRIHLGRPVLINHKFFPDYIVSLENSTKFGYEVRRVQSRFQARSIVHKVLEKLRLSDTEFLTKLYIILVLDDANNLSRVRSAIGDVKLPANVSVVIGHLEANDEEESGNPLFLADEEIPPPF